MTLGRGTTVGGRYEILDRIADGGMSTVYRARHPDGGLVALKILRPQYVADREFIERFAREAKAAQALDHPHIVRVLDSGRDGDTYFIAMEYVNGPDLKGHLRRMGRLEPADVERIGQAVCEALDYAHRQGIIHRDVKPQNILLAPDGTVKVADFGIARALAAVTITQPGVVLGTVQYLSPEQARGAPVGRTSDLYSLGVVLFEMLTGRPPFDGESPIAIALKHLHEPPPRARDVQPGVPMRLEAIIRKAMAKRGEDRYQSAKEMASDLIGATDLWKQGVPEEDSSTRTFEVVPQALPRPRSRRWPLSVGAALLALAVVGLWTGWQAVTGYLNVPEVVVPDLVGRSLVQAELIARQAGLTVEVAERAFSATVSQDVILAQDQPAGKRVKQGRRVGVVVSLGVQLTTVPNVVQRTVQEAQLALEAATLKTGSLQEAYDEVVGAGRVIRQEPPAGSRVAVDSPVSLLISRGPVEVEMPDLIGRPLTEARRLLEERGLVITHLRNTATTEVSPGVVVDQMPSAGSRLRPGGVNITVMVSVRPGQESAPPRAPVITAESHPVDPPSPRPGGPPLPASTPRPEGEGRGPTPPPGPEPGTRTAPSPRPSPALSPGVGKRTRIQVVVPEGGIQEVRIVVIDEAGVRTIYQAPHSPGDRIEQVVRSQGYTIIQVYVDGRLVQEVRP